MEARPAPEDSKPKLIQTRQRRNFRPRARVVPKPVAADLVGSANAEPAPPPTKKVAQQATATTQKKLVQATSMGSVTICAWPDCNEHARPRSKYCSRNCSNKNARARHKNRAKT